AATGLAEDRRPGRAGLLRGELLEPARPGGGARGRPDPRLPAARPVAGGGPRPARPCRPHRGARGGRPPPAFRLLGLWQGPSIGLPAAAALIGQPEDAVADALEVLVDAQLLQAPAPDRYRFHDLLRAYAAERASAQETQQDCDAAVQRLFGWYLHSVAAMARIVSPNRDQVPLEPPDITFKPLSF